MNAVDTLRANNMNAVDTLKILTFMVTEAEKLGFAIQGVSAGIGFETINLAVTRLVTIEIETSIADGRHFLEARKVTFFTANSSSCLDDFIASADLEINDESEVDYLELLAVVARFRDREIG